MKSQKEDTTAITRRDFIKVTGAFIVVAGTSGLSAPGTPMTANAPGTRHIFVPADGIPPADGYLLVDIEKCQGCVSCMLACSLIHEGVESLSLSRIQVMQNPFAGFPDDLTIEQCRQCVDPACVNVCPTGALHVDAQHGNVRVVDEAECVGCGRCFDACPFTPSRAFLVSDREDDDEESDDFGNQGTSRKCDLCANAPYHWDEAGGGPDGKQACVAVCPVGAIMFTREIPEQDGDGGYKVNLRDENWGTLGYPTS
jgi:protein NrfC